MLINRARVPGVAQLKPDSLFGPRTGAAIEAYQRHVLRMQQPDGVVDPGGPTLRALGRSAPTAAPAPRPAPAPRRPSAPAGGHGGSAAPAAPRSSGGGGNPAGISDAEYLEMATRIGCEVAAIKAVVQTEVAIRGAYDSSGRPTILFERHKFYTHTRGRFAASDPDICNSSAGGYGKFSEQYPKLERAMKLDREAALKSASWGAFQILGENHRQAGHATVDGFVNAMKASIHAQVRAFIAFVLADRRLVRALSNRQWATFASIYNGPAYKKNKYDDQMRSNYQRFANGA